MNRRELVTNSLAAWLALRLAPNAVAGDEAVPLPPGVVGSKDLRNSILGVPDDGCLALVDGQPISSREVIGILFAQEPDSLVGALEQTIRRRLVEGEATKLGVFVQPKIIEENVDAFLKEQIAAFHMRFPDMDFAMYMQDTYGVTPKAHRAILRDVALENELYARVVLYWLRSSARVQLRLITTDDLKRANELHEKLKEGANFAALARSDSKDGNTKKLGGLMPPLPVSSDHELVIASKDLAVGAFSDVRSDTRKGQTLHWIVKLEKRFPADPRPYAEAADEIELELKQRKLDLTECALWDQEARKHHDITMRLGR